jgi:hypothetical protein
MIYKFRIVDANGPWASYKTDAETEAKARVKATKALQEDVESGSLVVPFTLELMEDKP